MRKVTADRSRGLVWELTAQFDDCDFADNIAPFAHTKTDIQEKTSLVD
jgi:hypothetical protein